MPAAPQEGSTSLLQGPYLHCSGVPAWGAYAAMHRKANDNHLQLLEVSPLVRGVMVTDDRTGLRMPNTPSNDDNYVLGLAVDFTCDTVGRQGGRGRGTWPALHM